MDLQTSALHEDSGARAIDGARHYSDIRIRNFAPVHPPTGGEVKTAKQALELTEAIAAGRIDGEIRMSETGSSADALLHDALRAGRLLAFGVAPNDSEGVRYLAPPLWADPAIHLDVDLGQLAYRRGRPDAELLLEDVRLAPAQVAGGRLGWTETLTGKTQPATINDEVWAERWLREMGASGKLPSKPKALSRLQLERPSLTKGGFKRAWENAKLDFPEMGNPGRKSRPPN